jgi:hypothetical protein
MMKNVYCSLRKIEKFSAYLLAVVMVNILLTACGLVAVNETLDIKSPQALNGVWLGILSDFDKTKQVAVRLELTATTIDAQRYAVAGTIQFDNAEKLEVTGEVRAGKIPPVYFPAGAPSIFEATASKSGEVLWELRGNRFYNDDVRWQFSIEAPQDFARISGEITRE